MLKAVDKLDSAQLTSEEILHPEGWVLLGFICDPRTGLGRMKNFSVSNFDLMKMLSHDILGMGIDEILALPDVKERVDVYKSEHELFIKMVKEHTEVRGNVILSDLRGVEMHAGNRFLLYTLYPEQNISVWVVDGKKDVNDVITVGYSVINKSGKADVGSLMLKYGGGGHTKVGTCQVARSDSDRIIEEVVTALQDENN
jgi:nanoRNase/pAp phosphatase (c-di-AMP/oligoRNAs hydrolase)